jgi:hypothetical protein
MSATSSCEQGAGKADMYRHSLAGIRRVPGARLDGDDGKIMLVVPAGLELNAFERTCYDEYGR